MQKQHIGGFDLAYQDRGEGKETVILLHGFCGSSSYWEEVVPLLDSCRVITVDLRGHGQSGISDSAFTIEDMAKDIHYFMDQKQLENVYLFGHSLGGYITLAFAELYKEKLKGYGLIHSTALADSEAAKKNRLSSIEKIKKEGMHSFVDDLVPNLFNPERQEELKEKIQTAKEIGYETSPIGAIQTLKAMRNRTDRSDIVKNSDLPILLIAGEHDGVIPKEKVFIQEAPQIHTEVLPDSGHMGLFEEPEKLTYILKEFIVNSQ
ncbi:alpha/beta hydrolase [[Bacillus] enclensis]|uniref:Pimeloyl-ACP methyl ester carboxylesterase n=1 Tax=[Bacillus] enclensis TaxID=1402860 RepID=A0A0V8HLA5_9BACI|nr:alpha/beta hydrolase [[Bacillus] enclensis]OAT83986.1 alpha/beta hydrolase [Bacillus sp. MKU004]QTC43280.1 alpha/beta hydrolase [Bacillus sp. V3]KSU63427.1 alpha/beta hydrolase [[Bacillus] enclensis]MBH9967716.1 alpha/beta hydrolase [[Bacillus] enclensis]SCB83793.1 Pimeloyl-ACP methyl ester carboxylesterase [[Bacillus] enclensis]